MIDILIDVAGLLFLVFLGASVAVFFLLHKGGLMNDFLENFYGPVIDRVWDMWLEWIDFWEMQR